MDLLWKDKDVSLSFSECGVYNIQLYVEGKCTPLSKDTTLIVKKDPEVSLDKFDTLCPGQVVNFYNNVRYAWLCLLQMSNRAHSLPAA